MTPVQIERLQRILEKSVQVMESSADPDLVGKHCYITGGHVDLRTALLRAGIGAGFSYLPKSVLHGYISISDAGLDWAGEQCPATGSSLAVTVLLSD